MRRLAPVWLALATLALLALPGVAAAQEEEEENPPVIRLSFFKCDFGGGAGEAVNTELEERVVPVWKDLVAEGMIMEYGTFYHWWADEWNLGIYTIASSIQAIVDAEVEAGERLDAAYPDQDSALSAACPEHRDGFYTGGPSTASDM